MSGLTDTEETLEGTATMRSIERPGSAGEHLLQDRHGTIARAERFYRDQRLAGFDAAAVVEVIEHLDAARLASFERVLFDAWEVTGHSRFQPLSSAG